MRLRSAFGAARPAPPHSHTLNLPTELPNQRSGAGHCTALVVLRDGELGVLRMKKKAKPEGVRRPRGGILFSHWWIVVPSSASMIDERSRVRTTNDKEIFASQSEKREEMTAEGARKRS